MRITFASEQVAKSAVELWKQHGFDARRAGTTVTTDCPTLWAIPVLDRSFGLEQVQRVDVHNRRVATRHARDPRAKTAFERRRTDRARPVKE